MSTHHLCYGSKIRKIGIPQIYYIKVGNKGVYISRTCYSDEVVHIIFSHRHLWAIASLMLFRYHCFEYRPYSVIDIKMARFYHVEETNCMYTGFVRKNWNNFIIM